MITEDYVSFETAKLLKEKGFDWECISYYVSDEPDDVKYSFCGETNSIWESRCCSAPTLQMAMKWLREVYNIVICTHAYYPVDPYELSYRKNKPYWKICIMNHVYSRHYDSFNTYEEACEAAIKYCLTNLI